MLSLLELNIIFMKTTIGSVKNNLQILNIQPGAAGKHKLYECLCLLCNKTYKVTSNSYKAGKKCMCQKHLYNDLTNKTIGKVKVLKLVERSFNSNNKQGHLYLCKCNFCNKEYNLHTSILSRKGFKGCRCNSDDPLGGLYNIVYKSYLTNAKNRNLDFNLSKADFIELINLNCYYCKTEPTNLIKRKDMLFELKYNGIDRINNKEPYNLSNVVPCCKKCNWMKSDLSFQDFKDHIYKLYKNFNTHE